MLSHPSPFSHPPAILGQAIALRQIDMAFRSKAQEIRVLEGVSLEVPQGGFHIIMGPAGAGKTTLLLITAGLLTPTGGQVALLGHWLNQMGRSELTKFRLQHLGFVFQENNLLRSLTALENVEVALHLKGIQGKTARQQAKALLEAVQLGDKAQSLSRQLSGGQQQRVAIARALAGYPPLIIADEPTAALDSQTARIILNLLRYCVEDKGCTVLMSTHDSRWLTAGDRVAYLEDGILTDQPT